MSHVNTIGSHNILDGRVHPDSAAGTAVRGDIVVANSTPAWARVAVGAANKILGSDGTDPSWRSVAAADFGTQTANTRLAGPATVGAAAAAPTFRVMDKRDIPSFRMSGINAHGAGSSAFGESSATSGTVTNGVPDANNSCAWQAYDTTAVSGTPAGINQNNLTLRTVSGTNHRQQAMVRFVDYTASVRWWPLGITDQTLATMAAGDNPAGNYAAFRATQGTDTNYQCITKDNTTQSIGDSGVAVDTVQHLFEIIFNDSVPNVVFRIDGNIVSTRTANLPTANTNVRWFVGGQNATAVSRLLRMSWLYVFSDK